MIRLALKRQRTALVTAAIVVLLSAVGLIALFTGGLQFQGILQLLVLLMPLLLGLLTGTTVFARELDHDEHVFTLTQGVRRTTWWASGLGVAAAATAVGAGVLTLITSLAIDRLDLSLLSSPWFESSGIVVIAYALFAFAVAATVGLLTRSALTATVIASIIYIIVIFILAHVRVDYLPAQTSTTAVKALNQSTIPTGARYVDIEYLDRSGRPIPAGAVVEDPACAPDAPTPTCLQQAGAVTMVTHYQPATRYWPFQLIESAILVFLAGLCIAMGAIKLKRATAP